MVHIDRQPGQVFAGALVYRAEDHAFDFDEYPSEAAEGPRTSLLIGTIQVEVDVATRRLLFVWGYSPSAGWCQSPVRPVEGAAGRAYVPLGMELRPGMSQEVVQQSELRSKVDPERHVVQVLRDATVPQSSCEIAPGVGLLFADSELVGVELAPVNFTEIPLRSSSS